LNEEFYISLIGEAFDGYTESTIGDKDICFKHITIRDQRYLHKYYEKYKNLALKRGLETEAERIAAVTKDEVWSAEDDLKIESLQNEVENLKSTMNAVFLPSQRESIQKDLNKTKTYIKPNHIAGVKKDEDGDVVEIILDANFSSTYQPNQIYYDAQTGNLFKNIGKQGEAPRFIKVEY